MSFAWRDSHPNNPGSTPSDVLRRSSRETVNKPCTSTASLPWSTTPMRVAGSPRASHIARNLLSSVRGTATITLPADSEKSATNGFSALGNDDAATGFTGERGLDDGLHQPALGQIVRRRHQPVARRGGEHLGEQLLALKIDARRQPAEMVGGDLRPDRAVEFVAGVAEQDQRLAWLGAKPGGDAPA